MKILLTLSPRDYDAVLDFDGVLTKTARVHAAAWKKLFDGFLEQRATKAGEPFVPFDIDADYLSYVDLQAALRWRRGLSQIARIELPMGANGDGAEVQKATRWAI